MRAIVTGGAGFISSHLADALTAADYRVLIIDNLSAGRVGNAQSALRAGAELAETDVTRKDKLYEVVGSFQPDIIFHFAAHVDVRDSVVDPSFDAHSNTIGSVNIFSAAAECGVGRVVNASTGGAIYGDKAKIPTRESDVTDPISPYGLSKLAAESYARWFRRSRGLNVVTLRFGNVYGERQDPAHGAVVARLCDQAVRGAKFEIFGTGDATRDYIYVSDAVTAAVAAGRRKCLNHDTYNVGSGVETSVRQLADVVAAAAGNMPGPLEIVHQPSRHGEVMRSCLDNSRSRSEEIMPPPAPLEKGIQATLAWYRAACEA